jgi:hypothetical protein
VEECNVGEECVTKDEEEEDLPQQQEQPQDTIHNLDIAHHYGYRMDLAISFKEFLSVRKRHLSTNEDAYGWNRKQKILIRIDICKTWSYYCKRTTTKQQFKLVLATFGYFIKTFLVYKIEFLFFYMPVPFVKRKCGVHFIVRLYFLKGISEHGSPVSAYATTKRRGGNSGSTENAIDRLLQAERRSAPQKMIVKKPVKGFVTKGMQEWVRMERMRQREYEIPIE